MTPQIKSDFRGGASQKVHGVAAGAGGGTLYLMLAQSITNPTWQKIAVYLAPSVAVVLTATWVWMRQFINDYLDERVRKRAFGQAEDVLKGIINDPNTSPEEVERTKKDWDRLQTIKREAALEVISRITRQQRRDLSTTKPTTAVETNERPAR